MKEYTYYFADGTKNTILIEDEWCDILKEMDEEERKARYNYNRHNSPMSVFEYDGKDFADPQGDAFDVLMRKAGQEKVEEFMNTLTDCQRCLFEAVFFERKKEKEIAEEEGVCFQAVNNRVARIKIKAIKFFG